MITASEVAQMSDQQVADLINDFFMLSACLLKEQGGTVLVSNETRANISPSPVITMQEDIPRWGILVKLEE